MDRPRKKPEYVYIFLDLLARNIIIQGSISLVLVLAMVYMYINGLNVPSEFVNVVMLIIGFYFGSKAVTNSNN